MIHFRLLTRPPVKGFRAPLPREAGKEILFWGLRRSCLRELLLSLFAFFALGLASPSTSMSIKRWLARDSHSTSVVEAGQRRLGVLRGR
jgi:hypothetical protein